MTPLALFFRLWDAIADRIIGWALDVCGEDDVDEAAA